MRNYLVVILMKDQRSAILFPRTGWKIFKLKNFQVRILDFSVRELNSYLLSLIHTRAKLQNIEKYGNLWESPIQLFYLLQLYCIT